MVLTPAEYARLKKRLKFKYQKEISSLKKTLLRHPSSRIQEWIRENWVELKEFSHIKWLFLKQVQFFFLLQDQAPTLSKDPADFTHIDDQIFERLSKSEFADVFLKSLNNGNSIQKATLQTLIHLDWHLFILGQRHILKKNDFHKSYRPQTSLGELSKGKAVQRLLGTTLHIQGTEVTLMTKTLKEMKLQSSRIETALKVIRRFSPGSWERFVAFTDTIIPIEQKEFISFSHQEFPGTSMINLIDRDFIDLMDDLLHETGHHHLNSYLNLEKLIDEPNDCIYYSPWRRTLRPLRGIYHAYFTFFWAFELFSALSKAKEKDSIFYLFSPQEKEKIYWRAVEEFWMLDYTYQDLLWAKRKGLIHRKGWELVQEQRCKLNRIKAHVSVWEKNLKFHKKELGLLKKKLSTATVKYKKS